MRKIHLLIIDPQNDFCDPNGSLFVPGANEDMTRLASMVNRLSDKIDDIHVTLDSHHTVDIAHPIFWTNSNGQRPNPFTIITAQDIIDGTWTTRHPAFNKRAKEYIEQLEAAGRYPLCIWPPHCRIGTKGHAIFPDLSDALLGWEEDNFAKVNFVTKGSNIFVEHYSAFQAEVPDPSDETTQPNMALIDMLQEADLILITGEALSHCVANTIRDIANNFGEENIKKFVLLTDTCSNVPSFEQLGEDFISEMSTRGMQVKTSEEFLANIPSDSEPVPA
jgi:nicotinamidase-related amidase